jgi:hypothetical protein
MSGAKSPDVDVSVIIVSFNTRELTLDCLRSVYRETRGVTFEVFVVDNASSDGSVEAISAEFPHVHLIANRENRGFATANNQALRAGRGRWLLLLNSDTVVLDGAIDKSVGHADAHPEAGVIGCRALWPDGARQSTCMRFPTIGDILIASTNVWRVFPSLALARYPALDFTRDQDVDVVAGCFLLIGRHVLERVGLLDEDFFMYGEETEWCYRVRQAGWAVRYFAGAEIIHYWGGSAGKESHRVSMQFHKRRAYLLILHKTRGPGYAWLANLVLAFGVLLRAPFWVLAAIWNLVRGRGVAGVIGEAGRRIAFHAAGLFRPVWLPNLAARQHLPQS